MKFSCHFTIVYGSKRLIPFRLTGFLFLKSMLYFLYCESTFESLYFHRGVRQRIVKICKELFADIVQPLYSVWGEKRFSFPAYFGNFKDLFTNHGQEGIEQTNSLFFFFFFGLVISGLGWCYPLISLPLSFYFSWLNSFSKRPLTEWNLLTRPQQKSMFSRMAKSFSYLIVLCL